MRRRDRTTTTPLGTVPAWLVTFDASRWVDPSDDPPEGWAFGVRMWRQIRARQRWEDAGRAWLAEHGHDPAAWYELTRPKVAS